MLKNEFDFYGGGIGCCTARKGWLNLANSAVSVGSLYHSFDRIHAGFVGCVRLMLIGECCSCCILCVRGNVRSGYGSSGQHTKNGICYVSVDKCHIYCGACCLGFSQT